MVAPDGRPPGNDPAAHHRRTVSMPPERPLVRCRSPGNDDCLTSSANDDTGVPVLASLMTGAATPSAPTSGIDIYLRDVCPC